MNTGIGYTILFCLLLIFYKTSRRFKFYAKMIAYLLFLTVISTFLIPIFSFRPRNPHNLIMLSICCKPVRALLGIKYILEGKKHLEMEEPFVIVMNHQSIIDVLAFLVCVETVKRCKIIAKNKIFWTTGPFGIMCWLSGLVFIKQTYSEQTETVLNKAIEEVKRKKYKLLICPEGGVQNNGIIQSFKRGAFHLAVKAQLPVVPVVVSQLTFFDRANKTFDSGKVIMKALPPISTEKLTAVDVPELTDKTKNLMNKTFTELNQKHIASCF